MKKGFTLIELLAVIVILAIIALIAVPIILNIIGDTKKESNERSKELYLEAVKGAIVRKNLTEEFNPKTCTVIKENGNLTCDVGNLTVEVNGIKPCGGSIILDNGEIKSSNLSYCDGNDISHEDKKYKDASGANEPELLDGLTPVVYKEDHWEVANTSKEWYNYEKQEWANAVILSETGKNKKVGETIVFPTSTDDVANSDVVAMFVWIPRYEYKIEGQYGKHSDGTEGTKTLPGEIEINFIEKETTEVSSAGYIVHPAFTFGDKNLSGIWAGKFETSHTSGTKSLACKNEFCTDADNLRIIPNVISLSSNNVSKLFFSARSMSREGNLFGLDSSTTDSHMMKNSEWGSVAYLSQSKYGKYENSVYEGAMKEVYMNNSSSHYTGRSGGAPGGGIAPEQEQYPNSSTSTTQYNSYGYYTYDGYKVDYSGNVTEERDLLKGTGASTTGNIYGIYDMSGGETEYVMGYLTTAYTNTWGARTDSGTETDYAKFANQPDAKYFDGYTETNALSCANCIGQALGETSGWYNDNATFVSTSSPWFSRGGGCIKESSAGTFYFGRNSGSSASNSFRVVLASIM